MLRENQGLYNGIHIRNNNSKYLDLSEKMELGNSLNSNNCIERNFNFGNEIKSSLGKSFDSCKEYFCEGNLAVNRRYNPTLNLNVNYTNLSKEMDSRKIGEESCKGNAIGLYESCNYLNLSDNSKKNISKNDKMNSLSLTDGKFRRERLIPACKGSIHTDYIIDNQRIGIGTYGSVRCGTNRLTGCIRAIKTVPLKRVEALEIFMKEINILKNLDHPNIVKLFETYQDDENIYLVMELCTGGELFDRIMSRGSFDELYAAHMMKQVFSTICYCHDHGIVHRDLKPENFLFLNEENTAPLKIIDFGLAARISSENAPLNTRAGTPYYVAPEVLQGNYDKQCDMWSLGVIMYILLCGYPPFNGSNDNIILNKVQRGLYVFNENDWEHVSFLAIDLIRRLLTYNPSERITARDALNHPWITRLTKDKLLIPTRSYICCSSCTRKCSSMIFEGSNTKNSISNMENNRMVNLDFVQNTGSCGTEKNSISSSSCLNILSNFRAFHRYNRFMKMALTVIAQQMTESQISNLKETFIILDANCDGTLTPQEIITGLKNSGITEFPSDLLAILSDIDSDGSGSIDYTEFIAATLDSKQYSKEHVYWAAFRVFDQDGNGKITANELLNLFCCNDQISTGFSERAMYDIKNMIKEVDVNGDGEIDFQEFLEMFRKSVNIS